MRASPGLRRESHPRPGGSSDDRHIREMFGRIVRRHDVMNQLMTGGRGVAWHREAPRLSVVTGAKRVLDVATGTGDLALAMAATGARSVVGLDFAGPMLRSAAVKAGDLGVVAFVVDDALRLPFADGRFDACIGAFALRERSRMRRTNADKRRAVETLLADPEWGQWSDREIARQCGVDHTFVGKVRDSLVTNTSERTYTDRYGNVRTMDTSNIGKSAPAAAATRQPAPTWTPPAYVPAELVDDLFPDDEPGMANELPAAVDWDAADVKAFDAVQAAMVVVLDGGAPDDPGQVRIADRDQQVPDVDRFLDERRREALAMIALWE